MLFLVEHSATAASAVAGAMAGRGKQVDLFGVVVLGLVTALGGGTVRDLILRDPPVFWVERPEFVHTAAGAALATFVIARFRKPPETLLLYVDAVGLALFTILGAEKALAHGTTATVAVTLGVVTGVAGGMLRDVLANEIPLVFRRQIYLYATAALSGALVFVLCGDGVDPSLRRAAGVSVALVLRLAAIQWRLRLPTFRPKD